jgi:hypothetical protein
LAATERLVDEIVLVPGYDEVQVSSPGGDQAASVLVPIKGNERVSVLFARDGCTDCNALYAWVDVYSTTKRVLSSASSSNVLDATLAALLDEQQATNLELKEMREQFDEFFNNVLCR